MREEYMIERQGKRFVLYAGLLEEAHARGLRSIETELLQVPGAENGEVAIARAVVRTEEGKFSGIGDASPGNVSRAIVPHIIRMAGSRRSRSSGMRRSHPSPHGRRSPYSPLVRRGRRPARARTRCPRRPCRRRASSSTIWRL